ncbi:MAG: Lipid A core - O-antigen ligase and related enzymes [uncultured Paraburkholderia sp.]|nr:MAG: Lipid A core - O-antigen ligase and related enzymes [uncultured Paraburkholderia sp.]CAH2780745.1 MAG: Lipid A core - O-antigen ligase and related enzymes [uncultured Paraburkholderia sp.]CAH2914081.1 MAG: Lipid A core - O-antigen ligase and related enzymes [uncultured Paraburkholderia sp.]CAH2916245.1 MAG: Lipid A core - O-antigen ligase and related enzymes [uncultured Paraburkholderia sp.]
MPTPFARYLSLVLLALALVLPYAVVNHTYPIPTFYAEFTALALYLLMGAGVVLLVATSQPRIGFASPIAALVSLLFGLLLVAQSVLLPVSQPSMNWLGGGFLLAALMAAHAGYGFARAKLNDTALRWAAGALVVGGLFAVFCQVIQLFHLEARVSPLVVAYNVTVERRPFGNMAQANHLATYIAFAMAGALFLVQTRRIAVAIWALVSTIFAVGLALTVSRGPWLQMGVIVVAGLWMALVQTRAEPQLRRSHRQWLIPVALAVLFFVVNALIRWANVRYHLELGQSAADRFKDAGQIAPRLALWKYGWTMFRTHPLLGVGWGEFPSYQYQFAKTLGGVEIANNSHDIFIDLLAKTGLIGLAIVLFGLVAWLVRVVRAPQSAARVFGIALIGVLVMHALVEYPQQYMFFLLPAMFVFGLLETRPLRLVPARVSFGAFAVSVFGGIAALYPVYRDYARAEVLYYGSRPAEQYRADPSFLFRAWGEYGMATLLPMNAMDLQHKLAMHRQAMALLPGENVLRRYAVLQALSGDTAAAFDTVERLKIFAEELKDWPAQLSYLYQLCDEQKTLAGFKAELVKRYGLPSSDVEQEDDGDEE